MTQTALSNSSTANEAASPHPHAVKHGNARGYLFIALATFSWGVAATFGRAVFTGRVHIGNDSFQAINPLILSQTRTTFAFLLLMPLLLLRRGPGGVKLTRPELLQCMLLGGVGIAGSNYFYYLALEKTTVATAIILQYLAPAFVLVYMLARRLQPASLQRILGVTLAIAGSVLAIGAVQWDAAFPFIRVRTNDLHFNTVGVAAGLGAAIAFAFANVFARHLVERNDRWRVFVYSMMGAAIVWLIVNPPWKIAAAHYTAAQWIFLWVFAIASMLIPYSFFFTGLQYLDATRAIVTSCLEPVFAILIAALALGELLGPFQVLGIAVTLTATVLIQLPDKKSKAEAIRVEMME
ncbi:MAG TPA: DMT family transporter [Terriglobales bacterium]